MAADGVHRLVHQIAVVTAEDALLLAENRKPLHEEAVEIFLRFRDFFGAENFHRSG